MPELQILLIENTKKALIELFDKQESFFFIVFIITGEASKPVLSAWSIESLNEEIKKKNLSDEEIDFIKWSYADSPYVDFGSKYFNIIQNIFQERGNLFEMEEEQAEIEYSFRLSLLTNTLKELDNEGFFSVYQDRNSIMINVEEIPPCDSNIERALFLNPESSIPLMEWISLNSIE